MNANGTIDIVIDRRIHAKEAVLRTCYWFLNEYEGSLGCDGDGNYVVTLNIDQGTTERRDVSRDFKKMLVENELRVIIENETRELRATLVSAAFYDRVINKAINSR